ncbi:MAG: amidohydrolase family protein [Gammaproteobacteria bacterium]|jgi:N-acyl-D-amino-acid deacylase|nr:amidohydrolase family protein [Gammaproteobacteria bacterium]MBT5051653.1 amidohydrolase family protein [Gammaproteobacteria bacterium]
MFDTVIRGAQIVDGNGDAPFSGDIAIQDGLIQAVGTFEGRGREEIQADGAVATPGWVDVHTHYDGQVSWDDTLDPSFSHGVTSVVMGNCGVGFAPAPPGGEQRLIELMEGVEDIPGTALYEGIEWGRWETFPEYLDYIASRQYTLDVGTQVPHSALRNYVMGDRALRHENATAADLSAMALIVQQAVEAGALGFSTSRTVGHRSVLGETIPGTFAERDELMALANAMKAAGRGVFQAVPAGVVGDLAGPEHQTTEQEVALFVDIAKQSGCPVTFTLAQNFNRPDQWRACLDLVATACGQGLAVVPQIATRPIGFVTSLKSYHMFQRRRTYLELATLSFEERLKALRKPEVKAKILSDEDIKPELSGSMENIYGLLGMAAASMFPLEVPMNYEPEAGGNLGALAAKAGQAIDSFVYDFLLGNNGNNFAISLGANFVEGNFNVISEMIQHPNTTIGLSDAGAHVNLIFDAVGPTYQLMHWVRDRSRGPRLPIELIVAKQTARNADLFGLSDRGRIRPGQRADLNVIDLERLSLGALQVTHDLPAGGGRILQSASGYLNTFVAGVKTREHDQDTGARPGRLIRS